MLGFLAVASFDDVNLPLNTQSYGSFMPTVADVSLESHIRYSGNAILYVNTDNSWSVGLNTNALSKIQFGSYTSITDDTFGFSATAVEKASAGGYTLFLRSNADNSTIVQVSLDAHGQVDPASVAALTQSQIDSTESTLSFDLNGNGGFGSAPVAVQGDGKISLFSSDTGAFQVGADAAHLQTITVGGKPLTQNLLPAGWNITDVTSTATGYTVYVQDSGGNVISAQLDSNAAFTGDTTLTPTQVMSAETTLNVPLNGHDNVAAVAGWTSVLTDSLIKSTINSDIAPNGHMTYAQLVGLMDSIVSEHQAAGNTPISANELADLKALSARGASVFASAQGDAATTDYLSSIFSKLVDGSVANDFYNGGQATSTQLGNLIAGSSVDTLQKLTDKWLHGGDLPSPTAGGDAAHGTVSTTVGVYAQSSGTLFNQGGPLSTDINQGQLGDCYFAATLVSVAAVKPSAITNEFVDNGVSNGTHTWGVRFMDANGNANWVTVNDMLPVSASGSTSLVFGGGDPTHYLNGDIWFPLLEKAYVEANTLKILPRGTTVGVNAYWAIEGGWGDPISQLLGGTVTDYTYDPNVTLGNNSYISLSYVDRSSTAALQNLQSTLLGDLNQGKVIWIGSDVKTNDTYNNTLLTSGHAFCAIHANSDPTSTLVNVWNPWGVDNLPTPPARTDLGYVSPFTYDLATLIAMPNVNFMVGG
jgi:hypothetical protein